MIREEVLKPLAGPTGALGISRETRLDLGKERRTTTRAPPGEMLTAVANSRESLSFRSRVRINIGMARCNRAHLRSSFLGEMRRTYLDHLERYQPRQPHLRGQTSERSQAAWNRSKPRHRHGDYRSNCEAAGYNNDHWSCQKGATFFASVPLRGLFQLTAEDT
jgi:hypothetical protein